MSPSDNDFFNKAKTLTPLRSGPQLVTGVTPSSGADPVSKMSNTEKLRRTVEYALSLPTLSAEIKRALGELLNPENLAIAAGVMVVWAAAHFFGVGEVVDVILVGVAYATLGVQGIKGLANLVEFGYDVINAESDFDLRRAADKLAQAFVALGVEVVMALLLRKAQIKPTGAKDAPSSRGPAPKSEAPPRSPVPPQETRAPSHKLVDNRVTKGWDKFNPELNAPFQKRLEQFRGNDSLQVENGLRGGEGQLFLSDKAPDKALKRWFEKRQVDMAQSIKLLEDAGAAVKANPKLGLDVKVVKIHEQGPDWVVRDYDPYSMPLKDAIGSSEASAASKRVLAELERMQSGGALPEALGNVLKKMKRVPPSDNIHWSAESGKILIIDLQ